MLSWLRSSSPSESAEKSGSTSQDLPQQSIASTSSPVVSDAVAVVPASPLPPSPRPSPLPPPPPRPTRKEVNPNAPYVIFACAGTAVGVGVLIGLRRVSQLRTKTMELSAAAAAAAAEAAEAGVVGGKASSGPIVSGARPGRTASILSKGSLAGVKTTASQQPSRGSPFQAVAAAVKGPEDAFAGTPSAKPLSPATASLLRKPLPGPGTPASGGQPLFPPSQARLNGPPTSATSSASTPGPTAPAPKATLRGLIKEGRKKDADEHEELPPMTTAVMLRAAGAFAMATGLAVFLVGGPFVAACWWLGVEEPADFTPMFRRKIVTIFPSLEEGLLREEAEAAAAAADASSSSASSSQISFAVPDFLRRSPPDATASSEATPSAYIPSILHQGAAPEGEEEHSIYAWFEGVKEAFEKDRLAEAAQRAEDARFYREWEQKMRQEGR